MQDVFMHCKSRTRCAMCAKCVDVVVVVCVVTVRAYAIIETLNYQALLQKSPVPEEQPQPQPAEEVCGVP